jgi:hypothetical protein
MRRWEFKQQSNYNRGNINSQESMTRTMSYAWKRLIKEKTVYYCSNKHYTWMNILDKIRFEVNIDYKGNAKSKLTISEEYLNWTWKQNYSLNVHLVCFFWFLTFKHWCFRLEGISILIRKISFSYHLIFCSLDRHFQHNIQNVHININELNITFFVLVINHNLVDRFSSGWKW